MPSTTQGLGGQELPESFRLGPGPTGDDLAFEIARLSYWRHRIELGGGLVTPGTRDRRFYEALRLGDLRGRSVLDVGAWDGLFSFEAERHGAKRVLATDVWSAPPEDPEWWKALRPGSSGFFLAKSALRSSVDYKEISVYDLSKSSVGDFDVVLFLGVLYHLQDPFLALRHIADVTKDIAVVETHVARGFSRGPVMEFYAGKDLVENPSNWWGPNVECLRRMLLSAGFKAVDVLPTSASLEIPRLPVGIVRTGPHELSGFPPGEDGVVATLPPRSACLILAETTWKGATWCRVEAFLHGKRIQGYLPADTIRRLSPRTAYALQRVRSIWSRELGRRATLIGRKIPPSV